MTVFSVRHITGYRYRRPVRFGQHRVMFRPRDSYDQRLIESRARRRPAAERRCAGSTTSSETASRWSSSPGTADELRFETRIRLEHTPQAEPDLETDRAALIYPFAYDPEEAADLATTMRPALSRRRGATAGRGGSCSRRHDRDRAAADDAVLRDPRELRLPAAPSPAPSRRALTLQLRRGTCRDFALLMMEAVRTLGFAARFVTGYVYVPEPRRRRRDPRRRVDPCLVPGLPAGRGLGRVRPDQRHRRQPRPDPRRRWRATRRRRCRSAAATSAPPTTSRNDRRGQRDDRAGAGETPGRSVSLPGVGAGTGARTRRFASTPRAERGSETRADANPCRIRTGLRVPAADADAARA